MAAIGGTNLNSKKIRHRKFHTKNSAAEIPPQKILHRKIRCRKIHHRKKVPPCGTLSIQQQKIPFWKIQPQKILSGKFNGRKLHRGKFNHKKF